MRYAYPDHAGGTVAAPRFPYDDCTGCAGYGRRTVGQPVVRHHDGVKAVPGERREDRGAPPPRPLYEAERAPPGTPVTTLRRDEFVELLTEHYERLEPEARAMIPPKRVFIPID